MLMMTVAIQNLGRPRRGGSAGFSSSEVIAGFNLCTETTSTQLPTWRRKVLWDRLRTLYGPSYRGDGGGT